MRPRIAARFRLIFSNVCEGNQKNYNHNTKTDMQPIRTGDDCHCVGGNERKGGDRHKPSLEKEFNKIHTGKLQDHCSQHLDSPMKGLAGFMWRVPPMAIAPKSPDGKRERLQADEQTMLCIDYDQPGYKS